MEKKVYLANFKSFANGKGLKGRIYMDKLEEFLKADDKKRKFINVTIWENKEVGQYGHTHSMVLDTWEPQSADQSKQVRNDLPV